MKKLHEQSVILGETVQTREANKIHKFSVQLVNSRIRKQPGNTVFNEITVMDDIFLDAVDDADSSLTTTPVISDSTTQHQEERNTHREQDPQRRHVSSSEEIEDMIIDEPTFIAGERCMNFGSRSVENSNANNYINDSRCTTPAATMNTNTTQGDRFTNGQTAFAPSNNDNLLTWAPHPTLSGDDDTDDDDENNYVPIPEQRMRSQEHLLQPVSGSRHVSDIPWNTENASFELKNNSASSMRNDSTDGNFDEDVSSALEDTDFVQQHQQNIFGVGNNRRHSSSQQGLALSSSGSTRRSRRRRRATRHRHSFGGGSHGSTTSNMGAQLLPTSGFESTPTTEVLHMQENVSNESMNTRDCTSVTRYQEHIWSSIKQQASDSKRNLRIAQKLANRDAHKFGLSDLRSARATEQVLRHVSGQDQQIDNNSLFNSGILPAAPFDTDLLSTASWMSVDERMLSPSVLVAIQDQEYIRLQILAKTHLERKSLSLAAALGGIEALGEN